MVGCVNTLGLKMPFGDYDFKGDTITLSQGNTASSVLLSNEGRYIYSSDNFEFEFKDRLLTVTDDNDKIINVQSVSTLKSAYMYVAKNFYSFNGKTPDEMMFKKAQYNTWIELIYNQNQKRLHM